jgi:flavin-dependent dehydrogenase
MVTRASAEVVIAGSGPAAAAIAVALRSSGIRVLMLVSPRPVFRMAEAIPAVALPLFEALGLIDLVRQLGVPVRELENWLESNDPVTRQESFVLVDRAEFARRMVEAALLHGVTVEVVKQLPVLIHGDDHVGVKIAGCAREFEAAIDATGRAALWSRPIERSHQTLAHVFESPPMGNPAGLKLLQYDAGWAYRIGLRNYATIVLMSRRPRSPELPESLARTFGTSSSASKMIGRRTAGVQWSACPIKPRIIAVGDAALAHDPISGQGIRFALASAIAAAAVVRTWRRSPHDTRTPSDFYSEFVATELRRHLSFLSSLYGPSPGGADESAAFRLNVAGPNYLQLAPLPPEKLCFSGRVESAPLHVDGFIERGEVIRLRDGGAVRWLGGFDLLRLRVITRPAVTVSCLIESLSREGLDQYRSESIINWCIANGILR